MNNDKPLRVLVAAGSSRHGAYSGQLARAAARIAEAGGAAVTRIDLRSLELPVYDGDLEAASGVPAGGYRLRDLFASHDALLFVTPEYNGFPTPLFINAMDWLSRVPAQGDAPAGLAATAGKAAGLLSSSPGPLGGLRALNYTRQYLSMAFGMLVVPQQFALGQAHNAFDEQGVLKDAKHQQAVENVVRSLLKVGVALNRE
ncbi:MAG TPA: NAD(P)H-dependent oxidoreductase [Methylibium sp.]